MAKTTPRFQFHVLKKDPLPRDRRSKPATLTIQLANDFLRTKYKRNEVQVEVYERTTFQELRGLVQNQVRFGVSNPLVVSSHPLMSYSHHEEILCVAGTIRCDGPSC